MPKRHHEDLSMLKYPIHECDSVLPSKPLNMNFTTLRRTTKNDKIRKDSSNPSQNKYVSSIVQRAYSDRTYTLKSKNFQNFVYSDKISVNSIGSSFIPNSHIISAQKKTDNSIPNMSPSSREMIDLSLIDSDIGKKYITDLSRLLLFKSINNEPIDRLKILSQVMVDEQKNNKVASAVLNMAACRLANVWGFELRKFPNHMGKDPCFPPKFRDRYYALNTVACRISGIHSRELHGVHSIGCIKKGLLMLCLAFCFCSGEMKDGTRWITATDLYNLLHSVDENIPAGPPTSCRKTDYRYYDKLPTSFTNNKSDLSHVPNVDIELENFVQMDYLIRKKVNTININTNSSTYIYAMGPRAAIEIGKKQIAHFCAEILDEGPNSSMLNEILHR